jgi:hypothetical protein
VKGVRVKLRYKYNDIFCSHHYSKNTDYWFVQLDLNYSSKIFTHQYANTVYVELFRKCAKCGNIQTRDYDIEHIDRSMSIYPLCFNDLVSSIDLLNGVRLFIDIPTFSYHHNIWYNYYEPIKLSHENYILDIISINNIRRDKIITELLNG